MWFSEITLTHFFPFLVAASFPFPCLGSLGFSMLQRGCWLQRNSSGVWSLHSHEVRAAISGCGVWNL